MLLLPLLAHAEEATFKSWRAWCDNVRDCAAYAYQEESTTTGYLRVYRGGGPTSEPEISVGLWSDTPPGSVELSTVGGPAVATLTIPITGDGYPAGIATGAPARLFAEALANARTVVVKTRGAELFTIDLAGSSATLRWLDDRQARAGTTTALVAKGPKPAPPAPVVPVITRGPEVSQDGLPKELPAAIKRSAAYEECVADWGDMEMDTTVDRLSPGVLLWGVSCTRGAYNFGTRYWLSAEDGTKVRPAAIPTADGDLLINSGYDPASRSLTEFSKGRGIGDCGSAGDWVWDGQKFQQANSWLMSFCVGVPVEQWASVFHAEVK